MERLLSLEVSNDLRSPWYYIVAVPLKGRLRPLMLLKG
jgi:hypothetical protein